MGSNSQPSSVGNVVAGLASIGSTGGLTGRSMDLRIRLGPVAEWHDTDEDDRGTLRRIGRRLSSVVGARPRARRHRACSTGSRQRRRARSGRLLDVGTGAGILAIEAVRRWPGVAVTGLDGSAEMLAVAAATVAGRSCRQSASAGIELDPRPRRAAAVRDGLVRRRGQLVRLSAGAAPERRPGRGPAGPPAGRPAGVRHLAVGDERFAPDEAFEDGPRRARRSTTTAEAEEARAGDLASAGAMRHASAGSVSAAVVAREAWLTYDHDPATLCSTSWRSTPSGSCSLDLEPDERRTPAGRDGTEARAPQAGRFAGACRSSTARALRPESS